MRWAHLGKGWSFPVRPCNGRLSYVTDETSIEQAISIILQTARNERVMRPNFGAGLQNSVFSANTSATHRTVENEVSQALLYWEPRIHIERVSATSDPEETNLLLIEIDYRVRRTNAFYNRVFPFYLTEGA